MGNGNDKKDPLQTMYRAAVIILLAIAGFISANIYNQVSQFPKDYVSLERYKCDIEQLSKGIADIGHKIDRVILRQKEHNE